MNHPVSTHLADNAENNRGYYYALASVTFLSYIASLTGITLLYIYFTTVSMAAPTSHSLI